MAHFCLGYIKFQAKVNKTCKIIPTWIYGAVASVALLLSVFYFNNSSSNFSTEHGEQLIVNLPDNSTVHLSPNSSLEFKEKGWNENRNLSLIGNAYFEVEDFGNARWSYEMGLKLNPFNEDLINNNNVNKSFIENYIEVTKNYILDNVNIFFQSLSVNKFILIN